MPVKYKYTFLCLLVICVTLLCFIWMVKDRLCEFTLKEQNNELRRSLLTKQGSNCSAGEQSPAFQSTDGLGLKAPTLISKNTQPPF
ncbi:Hok/Gef family protein [Atlantibacter sp.]|uniref:Hok/Gef family protein n=1 Tax=Atlantibacter TaxID=1903434 RepID=UPI0039180D73